MHYSRRLGLIAGALVLTSAFAFADEAKAPAAASQPIVVNGVTISPERFDFLIREMTKAGQPDTPELRDNVRRQLIDSVLLSQEALKSGLDKDPDVQARLELSRQAILAQQHVAAWRKANPVSEETLKAMYEKKKPEMTSKETRLRHILVKTQKEALKILADLKKGKKFEDLAKQYSMDEGTKPTGGDLGWIDLARVNFDPAFLAGLTGLENGQITPKPVQSSFGFHIIQKMGERDNAPTLEQIRPQLEREVEGKQIEDYIASLRAKADIK